MPTLQHLSLEFELQQHCEEDATTLAIIMAQAPALRSLCLLFDEFSWDDPFAIICLLYIIDHTIQWAHLQHLSLQAIAATKEGLRTVLLRHGALLRSLELSNMKFGDADILGQTQRGS